MFSAGAQPKPNFLVILTDDQGRGDYGAFGTKDIRTPYMDRIFAEGMTFNNFYASSCVCSPTRASLLSGCYADRVGVPGLVRRPHDNNWGYLAPSAVLLPAALKPAGYHSAIVGKWNLGFDPPNTPNDRGFDLFHGFLADMMNDYWNHLRQGENFLRLNRETVDPKGHATDIFTEWACEYLRERAKDTNRPFFLYLAYNAPHEPVQPPPEWLEKVKAREPNLDPKRAKLVALIEHLDDGIGKVMATLKETGLDDNTLVIFTSDNGGFLPSGANVGPWRSGKGHMYEGGLRVPGAARWPGHIKPGSVTDHIALSMDIYPTLTEAAGAKNPADIDALSFLPTLLGKDQGAEKRDLYFVRREGGATYGGKTIEAIRRGPWKLLQDSPYAPLELYNLDEDPLEKNNLAEKNKKIFNELSADLRKQIQRAGSVPWEPPEK